MISILTYNINGLPWTPDNTSPIANWCGTCTADILCFQEVFTTHRQQTLRQLLESYGYHVYFPLDKIGSVVPSGLCTAIRTASAWSVVSTRFTPFLHYQFWDSFANKGFFSICLRHTTGKIIRILNTHMQSNWELPYLAGTIYTDPIRTEQLEEMVKEYGTSPPLTLIVGDLNQEGLIHPRVTNLCCGRHSPVITFPSTRTNVDHVAWLTGTGVCPRLQSIHIGSDVHWSDHSPVLCRVTI